MKREIIYSMETPFRDTFRIQGFRFGQGEKTVAIMGSMRGDEVHQQYICSQLVRNLVLLESRGRLMPDKEVLVIPSGNPFSMNIEKRFWAMDNTDINRMFPGYDKGETTQRIAAALFGALQGYSYGVQLASFYMPGDFVPHVRIVRTGFEDTQRAELFGLPYIALRKPQPYDTTLLNYNWQIWETKAFSIYGGGNSEVEGQTAPFMVGTMLRFLQRIGVVAKGGNTTPAYSPSIVDEKDLLHLKAPVAGILMREKTAGAEVHRGEKIAKIIDPLEGGVISEIESPADGIIFYAYNKPLTLQNTLLFKVLEG